eukprot:gene15916-biopygen8206
MLKKREAEAQAVGPPGRTILTTTFPDPGNGGPYWLLLFRWDFRRFAPGPAPPSPVLGMCVRPCPAPVQVEQLKRLRDLLIGVLGRHLVAHHLLELGVQHQPFKDTARPFQTCCPGSVGFCTRRRLPPGTECVTGRTVWFGLIKKGSFLQQQQQQQQQQAAGTHSISQFSSAHRSSAPLSSPQLTSAQRSAA